MDESSSKTDERVSKVDASSSKTDERVLKVDESSSKTDERVSKVDESSSKTDERVSLVQKVRSLTPILQNKRQMPTWKARLNSDFLNYELRTTNYELNLALSLPFASLSQHQEIGYTAISPRLAANNLVLI